MIIEEKRLVMKFEIGESLLLSWLNHIKECQIVQTNRKASSKNLIGFPLDCTDAVKGSTETVAVSYFGDFFHLLGLKKIQMV
jgi:hypothetical protein